MKFFDLETDGTDPNTAKLKFAGFLDSETGECIILDHTKNEQIKDIIKKEKIFVGFNIKGFDIPIAERFGCSFKYKILVDLYEALSPRGDNGFGSNNKDRLRDINPILTFPNYKLKTIIETLKLDDEGNKGDIDYKIFQKNEWSEEERKEIEKYLKQDLLLVKKLFDWYNGIFKPIEKYLEKEDVRKFKHLTCTSGCFGYKVECKLTGMKEEYNDKETSKKLKKESVKIEGGYHLTPTHSKVRGKIICRDFVSQYPHNIIMYNLLPQKQTEAIQKILTERLIAKAKGDKVTALAYKVPINSIYGIIGNSTFKNIYNPNAAARCTEIGRQHIRRYAKTLEVAGFVPVYGFTDSCYVGIPKGLTEEDLDIVTKYFTDIIKKECPNPINSFGLSIDGKYKFMWFLGLNNYLYVTDKNHIGYKGGALFDKNAPECLIKLFDAFIKPKIIEQLDVNFTEEELQQQLKKIITEDIELASEEYSVKSLKEYKSKTSIQYQISNRYGEGKHKLIPNTSSLGVGKNKDLSYCSYKEFQEHNLTIDSISLKRMMKYIEPFYKAKDEVYEI